MRRHSIRTGVTRKQRSQRYVIKSWVNRLTDVPAFIVGNGPSLKHHENLPEILEPYFSIGINRSFYLLDSTILLWQDISLWNTEYHKLHNTQSLKVARDIADPRRIYFNFHLKGGPFQFDRDKTHILHGRGNSGILACELAVAMGCRPIILLGMDCKLAENGNTDFYGINPYWNSSTLKNCQSGLDFLKQQCPVEIYNCSSNNLWEQRSLKDVIAEIDPDGRRKKNRQVYVKMLLRI